MSTVRKIRLFFHHYFLDKQLKRQKRGRRFANFENARKIGILFDATDLDRRQLALEYADSLRKKRKRVRLLGFFDNRLENSNFTFKHFNRKHIDWAMRPKHRVISDFLKEDFDILINVDPQTQIYSEYIAALSKASLKVGPCTENTYCYDLMIDPGKSTDLKLFIKQVELLLQKTNTSHETTKI